MKTLLYCVRGVLFTLPAFYLTSCKEPQQTLPVPEAASAPAGISQAEQAYPYEAGVEKEGILFGKPVHYREINNQAVFEGDIILSTEQLGKQESARTESAGTTGAATHWPGGVVYYTIDGTLGNQDIVNAAIADIQSQTPIKFVPRSRQLNYVTFKAGPGNASSIGMTGKQQFITLGPGYNKGAVLHEIGHALGLFHEHSRADRDGTIKVNLDNADPNYKYNLYTYSALGFQGLDYDVMDLGSIMMFDSYAFSVNGKPTMTLLNGSTFTVQRTQLSSKDISGIVAMYASLYAIKADKLYAIDGEKGMRAQLSGDWTGAQAILSQGDFIYIAKNGYLYKVNKLNGKPAGLMANFAEVKAMAFYNGYLYVINGAYLLKVDFNAGIKSTISQPVWSAAKSMCYVNGFLYILSNNTIQKVSPDNAAATTVKTGLTYGHRIAPYQDKVCAVVYDELVIYNFATNQQANMSPDYWDYNAKMTTVGNHVYITKNGFLFRVKSYNERVALTGDWTGMTMMTSDAPAL